MLPDWFNARVRQLTTSLAAQTLSRTRLTATDITVAGLVLISGSVWLLASGLFLWAGLLIALASAFDMLDGALARAKNETSRLGAFLDSTLDRYSEAVIFLGLLLYYLRTQPDSTNVTLIYVAIVGSILVSYVRARAEGLGFDCKVGLLERPERIILIVFGLLTGLMPVTLWVLAVLTHVTALQRMIHVLRQGRAEQAPRPRRRWRSAE